MRTVKPKGKAIDINKYINTGYDKVVIVADNMEMLEKLSLLLEDNDFNDVMAHLDEIVIVANSITQIVTVSGIADDVVVVANNVSDVVVVSHNIEDIKAVAAHIQAVQRVADSASNIDRLALSADALDIVATSVVSVDKVAASIDAVEAVSAISDSVVIVGANTENIAVVANDIEAVKSVPAQMEEIREAVSTTTANAQTSTTNANSALASKNAAAASESAANASKVASKASEDAAKMSELAAYSSELSSLANAEAAEASKTAAKAAETNAIANSTSSYDYSELARGYANAAEVSKSASSASASQSANSASASLASANAAKASETVSSASQVASKSSETAAKASETASKASETAAKNSEDIATAKAAQTAADAALTASHVTQTAANVALAEAAKDAAEAAASTVTGGIIDKGAWDASTGVFPAKPTRPLPEGGTALVSAFWKVTVAGTAGGISFLTGDDLRFSANTDEFYKVDNTDAVASVQGKTGAVILNASEVGALATPTGTHAEDKVLVAGASAGTSKYSPHTISKSVPADALFTDTVYTHPTNDGDLHVPATGTTSNGKVLVAGSTVGSAAWRALVTSDIGGLSTALAAKLDATANAVSASKLKNTVTINGVSFDGSANITITAANPFTLTRGTGLTGSDYTGAAATTWAVAYGTAAGTACQGNDSRLSDARTPLAHTHTIENTTGLQIALDSKYSATNKPTPSEIGALPLSGGKLTGALGLSGGLASGAVPIYSSDRIGFVIDSISSQAQGINAGSLLVSSSWSDVAKVPSEGIYSKGDVVVGGKVKASGTGGLVTESATGWSYMALKSGAYEAHIAQSDVAVEGAAANSLHLRPRGVVLGSLQLQPDAPMRHVTTHGTISIGSVNPAWAHFSTDRPSFHFDKGLGVQGEIYAGGAYNQRVYHQGFKPTAAEIGALPSSGDVTANGGLGIANTLSDTRLGLSLYGGASNGLPEYGMTFTGTSGMALHGQVTGDWATYFTIGGANDRGWIFRCNGANVASVSGAGRLTASSMVRGTSTGHMYYDCGLETISEGSVIPRISFHKAGAYSGMIDMRNDSTFGFVNGDGSSFCDLMLKELNAVGNVKAFSDRRVKTDIKNIPDALDKVSKLNGVTYLRTDQEGAARQTGLIAQELEAVLPEAVTTSKNGDIEDFKSVAYGNVVGLLVEAIKELKAEIEELKNGIANQS